MAKKDWLSVLGISLGVMLVVTYLLELFTDWPIKTYTLVFFFAIGVSMYVVLKLTKYAKQSEKLEAEDFVLYLIVTGALVIFFLFAKSNWPSFSIVSENIVHAIPGVG